ncbi:MAG: DUF2834 domain-containing protein [Anaerolineales bacterium]|nr:DUF2834 domain-containing protein [Anaerolineales bacterium]
MLKPKNIYLALAILGVIVPYSQFIPWLMEHGLNLNLLFSEILASRLSSFAWLDVIVSAVALLVFIRNDKLNRSVPRLWLPIVGTLLIGVSFGLPMFLYLREEKSSS